MIKKRIIFGFIQLLAWFSFPGWSVAQEVSIPDAGLNYAVRAALGKPNGPLMESDLLTLTSLAANNLSISNTAGLEQALNLTSLELFNNQITNLALPSGMTNLTFLDVSANPLTNLTLPDGLTQLETLFIESTSLTRFTLPKGLTALQQLEVVGNTLLTSLVLLADMTNVTSLPLSFNALTNLTIPPNLTRLTMLDLTFDHLTSLKLPPGLISLTSLFMDGNGLTSLTLPPDMTKLSSLDVAENPLTNFIVSEPLAAANLAATVTNLQSQGIPVLTYPLALQLTPRLPQLVGAFRFNLRGPPGDYTVLSSTNLTTWIEFGTTHMPLGAIVITDTNARFFTQKFYRVSQ